MGSCDIEQVKTGHLLGQPLHIGVMEESFWVCSRLCFSVMLQPLGGVMLFNLISLCSHCRQLTNFICLVITDLFKRIARPTFKLNGWNGGESDIWAIEIAIYVFSLSFISFNKLSYWFQTYQRPAQPKWLLAKEGAFLGRNFWEKRDSRNRNYGHIGHIGLVYIEIWTPKKALFLV